MRSLLLREAIGLDPARAAAAAEASRRWLAARADGGRRRYGLAPHAPYSAAPALLSACRTLAAGRALAIHVAEDPAERRFTEKGDGPFRDFLERLGVPLDDFRPSGLAPVRYLASLGLLGPETLLIHANDLCGGDVDAIARSGAAVVYCPGTHAFFDRPPHPLPALVAAGVPVGIGTDSAASNAGLSMRAELRLLREQFPSLDAAAVFALGAGAALGRFFPGAGRLAEGGDADIAVVDLGAPASERRPLEAALSAEARDRLTLAGGAVAAAALE
jgi:cytosine/adenosine deaminase-related metal-dependent hydrolase